MTPDDEFRTFSQWWESPEGREAQALLEENYEAGMAMAWNAALEAAEEVAGDGGYLISKLFFVHR